MSYSWASPIPCKAETLGMDPSPYTSVLFKRVVIGISKDRKFLFHNTRYSFLRKCPNVSPCNFQPVGPSSSLEPEKVRSLFYMASLQVVEDHNHVFHGLSFSRGYIPQMTWFPVLSASYQPCSKFLTLHFVHCFIF